MNHLSVDQALIKAKSLIKNDKLDEARLYCEDILKSFPKNSRAKDLLTSIQNPKIPQDIFKNIIMLYNQGNFQQVIDNSSKILDLYKEHSIIWNLNGLAKLSLAKYEEAKEAIEKAISLDQNNPEYLNNLGVIFEKQHNWLCAINAYEQALSFRPNFVEALFNVANVLKNQKKYDSSVLYYQKALKVKPNYIQVYNNLGSVLLDQGKIDEAIDILQKAIIINANYPNIHNNLGNAFQKKGDLVSSIKHYQQAIKLDPNFFQSYNNLGNSLKQQGQFFQAIEMFNNALAIDPNYFDALNNLGVAYQEKGMFCKAIKAFEMALKINPNFVDALYNLGIIMKDEQKFDLSIDFLNRALLLKSDFEAALAEKFHQLLYICNWDQIDENTKKATLLGTQKKVISPFSALSFDDNPKRHQKRSEIYAEVKFLNKSIPFKTRSLNSKKRIKIGYFSADFHDHATMYLISKIFALHDRSKFEIYAYSIGPKKDDFMRQNLIRSVDIFDDVSQMSDKDIAMLARQDEIDIAIDLKGYTHRSRTGIFAYRAAPIQINYLGYPGTMGADFIDYIIADKIIIPEEYKNYYSEEIIYMPHSYQPNDNSRQISKKEITKSDMGLPEDSFVFCSFNNSYKITPREFDIWMRIIMKVKGSVLWLLKSNQWVEDNLKIEAKKRGVDPSRLIFADKLPHDEHLARHRLADLFLDTFNVNAHTTASDALWAGLPVVTKLGKGFAARVAGSLLNAIDLQELITKNEQDYEKLILELALKPEKLNKIKNKLHKNRLSSPLFDTEKYTKDLENGYQKVYQNYVDGNKHEIIINS